jgi:hypothetical protein
VIAGAELELTPIGVDGSHGRTAGALSRCPVREFERDAVIARRRDGSGRTERDGSATRSCRHATADTQQTGDGDGRSRATAHSGRRATLGQPLSLSEQPRPSHHVCRREHDTKVRVRARPPGSGVQFCSRPLAGTHDALTVIDDANGNSSSTLDGGSDRAGWSAAAAAARARLATSPERGRGRYGERRR